MADLGSGHAYGTRPNPDITTQGRLTNRVLLLIPKVSAHRKQVHLPCFPSAKRFRELSLRSRWLTTSSSFTCTAFSCSRGCSPCFLDFLLLVYLRTVRFITLSLSAMLSDLFSEQFDSVQEHFDIYEDVLEVGRTAFIFMRLNEEIHFYCSGNAGAYSRPTYTRGDRGAQRR